MMNGYDLGVVPSISDDKDQDCNCISLIICVTTERVEIRSVAAEHYARIAEAVQRLVYISDGFTNITTYSRTPWVNDPEIP